VLGGEGFGGGKIARGSRQKRVQPLNAHRKGLYLGGRYHSRVARKTEEVSKISRSARRMRKKKTIKETRIFKNGRVGFVFRVGDYVSAGKKKAILRKGGRAGEGGVTLRTSLREEVVI